MTTLFFEREHQQVTKELVFRILSDNRKITMGAMAKEEAETLEMIREMETELFGEIDILKFGEIAKSGFPIEPSRSRVRNEFAKIITAKLLEK